MVYIERTYEELEAKIKEWVDQDQYPDRVSLVMGVGEYSPVC